MKKKLVLLLLLTSYTITGCSTITDLIGSDASSSDSVQNVNVEEKEVAKDITEAIASTSSEYIPDTNVDEETDEVVLEEIVTQMDDEAVDASDTVITIKDGVASYDIFMNSNIHLPLGNGYSFVDNHNEPASVYITNEEGTLKLYPSVTLTDGTFYTEDVLLRDTTTVISEERVGDTYTMFFTDEYDFYNCVCIVDDIGLFLLMGRDVDAINDLSKLLSITLD